MAPEVGRCTTESVRNQLNTVAARPVYKSWFMKDKGSYSTYTLESPGSQLRDPGRKHSPIMYINFPHPRRVLIIKRYSEYVFKLWTELSNDVRCSTVTGCTEQTFLEVSLSSNTHVTNKCDTHFWLEYTSSAVTAEAGEP